MSLSSASPAQPRLTVYVVPRLSHRLFTALMSGMIVPFGCRLSVMRYSPSTVTKPASSGSVPPTGVPMPCRVCSRAASSVAANGVHWLVGHAR